MTENTKIRNRFGWVRWLTLGLALMVIFIACTIAVLLWMMNRPKVDTTSPSTEEIALCRDLFLINPKLEIIPLGYFRLESLDISHGFKFIAKTNDPTELINENQRDRIQFLDHFDGGFIDRAERVAWWNRYQEGVFGGHFLNASDSFIWHSSMCYLPNDDGTLTVWVYGESGANYREQELVSSDRMEFRGHYYQFVVGKEWLSWDEAVAQCEEMGGYLVIINDEKENDFLTHFSRLGQFPGFLGAHKEKTNDTWQWVDGSPLSYQNWIEGQPISAQGEENYLRAQPLVWPGWCAFPGHALGFVCEWDSEPTKE